MNFTEPDLARTAADALSRLEADLRSLVRPPSAALATDGTADVHDFKDAADDEMRAVVDDAVATHALAELQAVRDARRRIADGTYGDCLSCGEPIDRQRLLALPHAALCAACQSDQERAQAHLAS